MDYFSFKRKFESFPIISSSQLTFFERNAQVLRNQLVRWGKKGLIVKLKKGLYVLNDSDRKINPSRTFLANQIYSPSYISTEYALGYYEMIPEKVVDVTSVTPRKTYKIRNTFGEFIYQHIAPKAFTGFTAVKDENSSNILIATPEKAMIDFIYLNLSRFRRDDMDVFAESYRLQNIEKLKGRALKELSSYFDNDKLTGVVKNLCELIKKR